jgi:hypothetical protein
MQRLLAAISLTLLLSCNKDEATAAGTSASASSSSAPTASAMASSPSTAPGAASASAAASAAAADAPPLPKCPAGLVGNAFPAYCIKVPSAYTVKQARTSPKRGSIEYETGTSTDNLMITYDESPIAQLSKDVESEMKFGGDKLEKKGDLPGGNKWFQGKHAEYSRIVTLFKGQGAVTLKCSFAYQPKASPPKDAIDACKSIVVP